MKRNDKFGFTLVELLAVIVILAIILVIAVPKIMDVINDSKKATIESTVKMIASAAEKAKVQNTLLGNTATITCDDVVKLNDIDYEKCIIEFDNDRALVTIKGSGKFVNLNVCEGDKISATASNENCEVSYGNASAYIEKLEAFKANENHLQKTTATHNGITYDTGIRYVGELSEVNNQVYYNCEPTDGTNAYGSENYNYASSCEIWRIIGVFDVDNGNGVKEKRIKLINTASTFTASWDSSASNVNNGGGINQWGPSTLTDGSAYLGADLMRLLNGFYIGKSNSECKYCTGVGQATCEEICTSESLKSANMKELTSTAKGVIGNAVWDTYGVTWSDVRDVTWAGTAYLQEKGITHQYTGKICSSTSTYEGIHLCTDTVKRTVGWTGLVGLMSVSDITYSDGWLYASGTSLYPQSISPAVSSDAACSVWNAFSTKTGSAPVNVVFEVWPALYLKSDIQIIGGNGGTEPYKLSVR